MVRVTQAHHDAAKQAGACASAFTDYPIGTELADIARLDLYWVETHLPEIADECCLAAIGAYGLATRVVGRISLTLFAVSGYGFGAGPGWKSGEGAGAGHGEPDGSGYGAGHGCRYGCGFGDGYGARDGTGYGHGFGSGFGSGSPIR